MDGRRGFHWMLLAGLLLGAGPGCIWPGSKPPLAAPGKKPVGPPPATVALEGETPLVYHTRLIDQPAGSAYLNTGLWNDATNPLDHEQTTLLALNGLRVGVFGSQPPMELERLASSEASVLSPMLRSAAVGRPRVIPVNGPLESCTLGTRITLTAEAKPRKYELAECGLTVTSTPLPGDKLKVRGEFQIQHGERQPWLRPTSDGSGFARTDQRSSETYPELAFEVTLSRSDLLVVGATDDPTEKLGQAFFFANSVDRIRQRVLLVQVGTSETATGPAPVKEAAQAAPPKIRNASFTSR